MGSESWQLLRGKKKIARQLGPRLDWSKLLDVEDQEERHHLAKDPQLEVAEFKEREGWMNQKPSYLAHY